MIIINCFTFKLCTCFDYFLQWGTYRPIQEAFGSDTNYDVENSMDKLIAAYKKLQTDIVKDAFVNAENNGKC